MRLTLEDQDLWLIGTQKERDSVIAYCCSRYGRPNTDTSGWAHRIITLYTYYVFAERITFNSDSVLSAFLLQWPTSASEPRDQRTSLMYLTPDPGYYSKYDLDQHKF